MTGCTPKPIRRDQAFRFCCSPGVSCFNDCCRDLNQLLTPYDIVRLKNHFRLKSGEFLARYTRWHIGPGTGLPVVVLKEAEPVRRSCPFLTPEGCRVYAHRPSSCRLYPLVRTAGYSADSGEPTEAYMILKEPHCKGFMETGEQTVDRWITDQGLPEYNRFNDLLAKFISRKRRLRPGPLSPPDRRRVYTALYDLDAFRDCLEGEGAPGRAGVERFASNPARAGLQPQGSKHPGAPALSGCGRKTDTASLRAVVDPAEPEPAANDDRQLLQSAIEWLHATFFGSSG